MWNVILCIFACVIGASCYTDNKACASQSIKVGTFAVDEFQDVQWIIYKAIWESKDCAYITNTSEALPLKSLNNDRVTINGTNYNVVTTDKNNYIILWTCLDEPEGSNNSLLVLRPDSKDFNEDIFIYHNIKTRVSTKNDCLPNLKRSATSCPLVNVSSANFTNKQETPWKIYKGNWTVKNCSYIQDTNTKFSLAPNSTAVSELAINGTNYLVAATDSTSYVVLLSCDNANMDSLTVLRQNTVPFTIKLQIYNQEQSTISTFPQCAQNCKIQDVNTVSFHNPENTTWVIYRSNLTQANCSYIQSVNKNVTLEGVNQTNSSLLVLDSANYMVVATDNSTYIVLLSCDSNDTVLVLLKNSSSFHKNINIYKNQGNTTISTYKDCDSNPCKTEGINSASYTSNQTLIWSIYTTKWNGRNCSTISKTNNTHSFENFNTSLTTVENQTNTIVAMVWPKYVVLHACDKTNNLGVFRVLLPNTTRSFTQKVQIYKDIVTTVTTEEKCNFGTNASSNDDLMDFIYEVNKTTKTCYQILLVGRNLTILNSGNSFVENCTQINTLFTTDNKTTLCYRNISYAIKKVIVEPKYQILIYNSTRNVNNTKVKIWITSTHRKILTPINRNVTISNGRNVTLTTRKCTKNSASGINYPFNLWLNAIVLFMFLCRINKI